MDFQAEYQKLLQKKENAGGFKPLNLKSDIKLYTNEYVTTKQYNKKTKKFEWFDKRTNTFFDRTEAKKYVKSESETKLKKYYLENFGTETPFKDLAYLKEGANLEKYKNRKNLSIDRSSSLLHNFRNLISRKIEGSDQKVFDAKHDNEIKKREQFLIKSKEGTSYFKKDNAELEYKINQSVKNKEEQPINLKDVSANSRYVDMQKEQLRIDKKFNTYDGVTY